MHLIALSSFWGVVQNGHMNLDTGLMTIKKERTTFYWETLNAAPQYGSKYKLDTVNIFEVFKHFRFLIMVQAYIGIMPSLMKLDLVTTFYPQGSIIATNTQTLKSFKI